MNTLGQIMIRLEVERRDGGRNEERQLNQRREERINRNYNPYDEDDWYLKNIKVDVSNFDGRLDPQYYLDWVMSLEHYFKWYKMSQERRVCIAAMKQVGQAGQYWSNVERFIALRRQEPVWILDKMKAKLSQKYLPINFQDQQLNKWSRFTHETRSAAKYIEKFDVFLTRCSEFVDESPILILSIFRSGLSP